MRAQFNPFDGSLQATSAGAAVTSRRLSANQPGYARESHHVLYHKTRIFRIHCALSSGGNLIDLDWLVEATAGQMPLQMDTAARLFFDSGKSFYMCACRQDELRACIYFLPTKQNWLDVIRASSAIPGFYRSGVSLEGINYLDGGISDAIPVKERRRAPGR